MNNIVNKPIYRHMSRRSGLRNLIVEMRDQQTNKSTPPHKTGVWGVHDAFQL